ncbi:MAG: Na+/H+ antiporter subunit B [candidate division KSB1 bacterium]|nr:Na+/H+ antiporter subunit B [candidate division KSB1 bacterium]
MHSLILTIAIRHLHPLTLMFSIYMLMRGHNHPGGGFIAGLIAAASFAHLALAFGIQEARRRLHFTPHTFIGAGLLVALLSGIPSLLSGKPFMTARWFTLPLPLIGNFAIGTPLLFDTGVYLVVIGMTLLILFSLFEE